MSHALRRPPPCLKRQLKQTGAVVEGYRFFEGFFGHFWDNFSTLDVQGRPFWGHWVPWGPLGHQSVDLG